MKGTYEMEGTFLTRTLFSAVSLAKTPVAEQVMPHRESCYSAPTFRQSPQCDQPTSHAGSR